MPSLGIAPRPGGCPGHGTKPGQGTAPAPGVISGGCDLPSPGDWDSGNQAFALSRGSPKAPSPTPGTRPLVSWHALVPFTFRIQVSHQTQEPPSEFLPAAPGIQQGASRRSAFAADRPLRNVTNSVRLAARLCRDEDANPFTCVAETSGAVVATQGAGGAQRMNSTGCPTVAWGCCRLLRGPCGTAFRAADQLY